MSVESTGPYPTGPGTIAHLVSTAISECGALRVLAKQLSVSPSLVSQWHNGRSVPSASHAIAVAQAANCTADMAILAVYRSKLALALQEAGVTAQAASLLDLAYPKEVDDTPALRRVREIEGELSDLRVLCAEILNATSSISEDLFERLANVERAVGLAIDGG